MAVGSSGAELAHAGKSQRRLVSAWIGTAYAEPDAEGARRQWRTVATSSAFAYPSSPRLWAPPSGTCWPTALPGHAPREEEVNHGLMIRNDRRWPEAWRVLGLQQVELVMLGYNTPSLNMDGRGFEAHHLRVFRSHLSVQAGCYQNACFAASVAKAGTEDGHELFGHSIIVNPQGEIMAQATSWDDELIVADCDLDMCRLGRETIFDFARHRRPEHYGRITAQVGSEAPPAWAPGERRRDAAE